SDRASRSRSPTTTGMKMHRLLRRQLDAQFGSHADAPAGMSRLLSEIDAEYRRADQDREALSRALALVGDLAQRQALRTEPGKAAPRPAFSRALRRLFEQAPFAVIICDPGFHVTSWNAGAGRLFGYSAKHALGRELVPLLLPEGERSAAQAELREAASGGDPRKWHRPALTQTGEEIVYEWTVVPLRDKSGGAAGVAVLAQEPLAGRDRFAMALEASGDGAWDWDVRSKRLWVSEECRTNEGL